jgi:hypothetical protein
MTITDLAIKRPSFVIVIFISLALLAIFGTQISYENATKYKYTLCSIFKSLWGCLNPEVEALYTQKNLYFWYSLCLKLFFNFVMRDYVIVIEFKVRKR